jgi:hypothetical protein
MGRNIFVVAVSVLLIACGGSRKTNESKPADTGGITGLENLNEDFDPLQLAEPPIPIRPKMEEKQEATSTDESTAQRAGKIPKEIIGYRIQLFQTEDAREAREFQKDALLRLDIDTYVSHDNPYYKVRIGDFTGRYEAEGFLLTLEDKGYKGAWIVRTLIVNKAYKELEKRDGMND